MSDESATKPTTVSALEERLATLQGEIRTLSQRRADLLQGQGESAELARCERELRELRAERQQLLDARLHLERDVGAGSATPVRTPAPAPARRSSRTSTLVRLLVVMVVFGGVSLLVVGGLFTLSERVLAPAPIEGLATGAEGFDDDFTAPGQSAEQRLLGLYLAANRDRLFRTPSDDPSPVIFEVDSGETAVTIAERLETEGLIEDRELFRRLLQYRGADQQLEAGVFQLARNLTMDEIIVALQQGRLEEIQLTLPEGWRAEEMATALEAAEVVSAADYLALVRDPTPFRDLDFVAALPAGATLEGYLFPDTYRVLAREIDAESMIRLQLETFDQRLTPELRAAASAREMTLHEAVILASLVEREAVVSEERPLIASVYINRWLDGTVLNADPTIQYALGYQPESDSWWKRPLTRDDLALDSPYNSYLVRGLPPGPIASPGIDSLQATINAPDSALYYFVSRNDGTHVFAESYEEHLQNVAEFQSGE